MSKKKNKLGGLAQFLSPTTVNEANEAVKNDTIVKINIDNLVPDPYNMYGLREIESLAGMIASNNFHLEAIEVRPMDDGRYMIISGHRRRAAWEMLLKQGETEVKELPCIVRHFEDMHITVETNGVAEDTVITAEQQANIALILANRGQRKEKTIEEELWEIQQLEPYVRIMYNQQGRPKERGHFKAFFASVLNINASAFQRKKSLLKLTIRAKSALHDREINISVAGAIARMSPEEQDHVLDMLFSGELENTYKAVDMYRQSLKNNEPIPVSEDDDTEESEEVQPEPDSDSLPVFDTVEDDDEPEDAGSDEDHEPQVQEAEGNNPAEPEDEPEPESVDDDSPASQPKEVPTATAPAVFKEEDVPTPTDTGNPLNDTHKWFQSFFAAEIAKLERAEKYCIKMRDEYKASNEEMANIHAAMWDSCRDYVKNKLAMLKDKD